MSKEDCLDEEMHPEVKKWYAKMMSKLGKSKSEKKTAAVRKNGLAPCHEGKFRGRPRKKPVDEAPSL